MKVARMSALYPKNELPFLCKLGHPFATTPWREDFVVTFNFGSEFYVLGKH